MRQDDQSIVPLSTAVARFYALEQMGETFGRRSSDPRVRRVLHRLSLVFAALATPR